jgi:hypothetical protein
MNNIYQSLQGNMGLSKAIDYFTSHQITVALPLNDTQKYDLIADFNNKLQRISIKTSRRKNKYNTYTIQLRNTGGSSGHIKYRYFDKNDCDYIFVLTGDNKIYLIPTNIITSINSIDIGNKYSEYEVHIKQLSEYNNECKN